MENSKLYVQFTHSIVPERPDARKISKGNLASINLRHEPDIRVRQTKYTIPAEFAGDINELFEEVNKLIQERLEVKPDARTNF